MLTVRKSDIVENFHGTSVADPYRWLEDTNSVDTAEWERAMGVECTEYFCQSSSRTTDKERLTELWNFPKYFVPKKIKGRLFYQENDGLQNQAVLMMKNNEGEKVVIDPNALSEDGTVAVTNYSFDSDGRYVAYATSANGSDWQQIQVRDIATGNDLTDLIKWVKFTSITWHPSGEGFFYSRFPEPGTVSKEDESNHHKVYFHKLGTEQSADFLIHDQPQDKELMFSTILSYDKEYLCLHVSYGTAAENRFYVKKLDSQEGFSRILDDQDAEYSYIFNEGKRFYFKTDLDASKGRVIVIDLDSPGRENWTEVIPEQENVIDHIKFVNERFIIGFLKDAHHVVQLFHENGTFDKEINVPFIGSLTELSINKEENEMYFGLTSFLHPTTVFKYDITIDQLSVVAQSNLPFEVSDYETSQIFYRSKDGTNIPMFLTHKKGLKLDGQNPVILYGYGGFNISLSPSFNPAILRWLEKGGVYAVANLRGGSEYGEAWHKAGMLDKKQNVFDDFIAAGEWLIENKYTSTNKLSIMGGSNGGLLVAACMVQRPDLFGAVICRVPVIDMLRYHKFTIGRYWIPEYGNAENPSDFPYMYAYSPLHNVTEGEKYPAILIATADSDDRVVPAHAKKFTATLKELADPSTSVILRLESKAGHGLGKPTSKLIDEWVDFYDFLDKELV
ncbi:S9 family peptidase [Bacillus luteolus]|uniref:prolyl oligopeptidase n=1 Tax=Litchfieldia luteola TaxID=682179 RepID=A0ABR9QN67_9BACI|nr:prolyl oligopeptidase family serine peptidase [Cytobacillus luteolus]MBE4909950.1 S9 family peptidase [Cytobacillus luteolus]MBP1942494.1 prolyl oligopeptidase [Cytobacillus luteolus]